MVTVWLTMRWCIPKFTDWDRHTDLQVVTLKKVFELLWFIEELSMGIFIMLLSLFFKTFFSILYKFAKDVSVFLYSLIVWVIFCIIGPLLIILLTPSTLHSRNSNTKWLIHRLLFNTTFCALVLFCDGHSLYWWKKPECLERNKDLRKEIWQSQSITIGFERTWQVWDSNSQPQRKQASYIVLWLLTLFCYWGPMLATKIIF